MKIAPRNVDLTSPIDTTPLFFHQVIERAGDFNILVMLDSHRLNDQVRSLFVGAWPSMMNRWFTYYYYYSTPMQEIPELWYNDEFPEEKMLEAWDTVLGDTKHHWNRESSLDQSIQTPIFLVPQSTDP